MFGNAIISPGMTVEVIPSIVGVPFSDTPTMRNIYDLGIGGLFSVTGTKVQLTQNNFETTITTKWQSKPELRVESLGDWSWDQEADFGGGMSFHEYPASTSPGAKGSSQVDVDNPFAETWGELR
jgi:hypothetical protein